MPAPWFPEDATLFTEPLKGRDLHPAETEFKELAKVFEDLLAETPTERWWFFSMCHLKRLQRNLSPLQPETQGFLMEVLPHILQMLAGETEQTLPESNDPRHEIVERSRVVMHRASLIFEWLGEPEVAHPLETCEISVRDLVAQFPENLQLASMPARELGIAYKPNKMLDVIEVRLKGAPGDTAKSGKVVDESEFRLKQAACLLPLPPAPVVAHKGGTPRVLLKILAGAPPDMIRAEIPLNDFDAIACGDPVHCVRAAKRIGVDESGIEFVEEFDFPMLFLGRDIDLNMCFLFGDRLVYTREALESARTGKIKLYGMERGRGIYGADTIWHAGIQLVNNRGMMRLIKFVAEGKARSFEHLPLNDQVSLGIYWLVLIRRFMDKPDFFVLLDRIWLVCRQMGQVLPSERTMIETLDRIHSLYPHFDFGDSSLEEERLSLWLTGKLMRYARRIFRRIYGLSLGLEFTREPGDTVPRIVSLEGYEPPPWRIGVIEEEWPEFLARCDRRNRGHEATGEFERSPVA